MEYVICTNHSHFFFPVLNIISNGIGKKDLTKHIWNGIIANLLLSLHRETKTDNNGHTVKRLKSIKWNFIFPSNDTTNNIPDRETRFFNFRSDIFNEEFRDKTRILKIIQGPVHRPLCNGWKRPVQPPEKGFLSVLACAKNEPKEEEEEEGKKAKARVILTEKLACSASIKVSSSFECNGTTI